MMHYLQLYNELFPLFQGVNEKDGRQQITQGAKPESCIGL